jgi:hypothetical protein
MDWLRNSMGINTFAQNAIKRGTQKTGRIMTMASNTATKPITLDFHPVTDGGST